MGRMLLMWGAGMIAAGCTATALGAETPLKSPWDLHPVKLRQEAYGCPSTQPLPVDITASDYYSDAKHSIPDPKRLAAYDAVKAQYATVTRDAEKAADRFQETGDAAAAACVMRILETQAQANAMAGSMSSNQAQYLQNWTIGALAVTYLKVRSAGADALEAPPAETASVQNWLRTVGQQVEDYFQKRREEKKTDGQNNHLYWAGLAVMSVGIAANDRGLYDWGVSTYKDGVDRIQPDGTLPLEMARGQKALHYHLFALAPLVTMAALGEANGDDLYAYDHNALHLLVSRSLAGLVDNHYFTVKAGAKQDTPANGVIKAGDVDWVLPYVDRFPDPGIRALLNRAGMRPDAYLGGLPPS